MSLLIFLQMEHMIKFLGGKHPTYTWEGRGLVPCTAWGYLLRNWDVRPPKTSLRCGKQLRNCFPSMGLLPWPSIEKDSIAQIQMGQKGAEVECSCFYLQAGCPLSARCSRLVRPWTWYVSTPPATGFLVFHVPIAIWRSHMIYSWTKPNKNKLKHKAKPLSMRPREFLDANCNADCSPD